MGEEAPSFSISAIFHQKIFESYIYVRLPSEVKVSNYKLALTRLVFYLMWNLFISVKIECKVYSILVQNVYIKLCNI